MILSSPTPSTSWDSWRARLSQAHRAADLQYQLDRYERRLSIAKSMSRRIRYGKKIRTLQARLTYLRIENS